MKRYTILAFFLIAFLAVLVPSWIKHSSSALASVSASGAVELILLPQHEDTSVKIVIDMTKLDFVNYRQLGIYCNKENGQTDFPLLKMSPMCGNYIKPPIENKTYTTVVSNLNPGSTYEFCLNGFDNHFLSTGNFECTTITTAPAKNPTALIFLNYDLSDQTRILVKRYEDTIKAANQSLTVLEYAPTLKITSSDLRTYLKNLYSTSNLKYVVLVGFDLPMPELSPGVSFTNPFRHLSLEDADIERDFFYSLNSEVTIAAIGGGSEAEMQNYFNRLYQFYTGAIRYDKKLLLADAMIPSESLISLADVPSRYSSAQTDYLAGITNYDNQSEATSWQNTYRNLLSKKHEINLIDAHGNMIMHYPCSGANCVNDSFIKSAQSNSEFVIGISCNISNFMTPGSPMVSYIFAGNSLAGLGAELPFLDSNGQITKYALQKIAGGMSIGDVSRMSGMVVIGDPFLRLDMPQDYTPTSATLVSFLNTDTTTGGNWKSKYGGEGYKIVGDEELLPTDSSFTTSAATWTWATNTTNEKALEKVSGLGRIAATWYHANTFTTNLNFFDDKTHQVALYMLDWDNGNRSQKVEIIDANTNKVLDTRQVSAITGGKYLLYNIKGNVKIKLTKNTGTNAVLSGIFLGGVRSPSAQASFISSDTTTKGNWKGVYGSDGYQIASDTSSLPKFAAFVPPISAWTWNNNPSDVKALQKGTLSGRIASTWYHATSFTTNLNLSDDQTHQIALYMLDWDNGNRSQTVEILDAATNQVLDSRQVSAMTGGKYLLYNIKGNVKIKVTKISGTNAILNGIFFGGAGNSV